MQDYTAVTRDWLDRRFRWVDADGVYHAHQPIYGFRRGPTEPGQIKRYTITWHIAQELARLQFDTFADIGGAEGYKAALVQHLFGAKVASCDLSAAACQMARDIYGIEAHAIDIHRLPFADGAFDVVLCSETLEHVPDIEQATRELLRIARRAVVITVPHERRQVVERNRRERIPHAHLHALDLHSFDHHAAPGCQVHARAMLSPLLHLPSVLADAKECRPDGRVPLSLQLYNRLCPLLRLLSGRRVAAALMRLDRVAGVLPAYDGMLVTLRKDARCVRSKPSRAVTPYDVLDFAVPLHRPAPATAEEPEPVLVGAAGRS